jgi:hypothetical protein
LPPFDIGAFRTSFPEFADLVTYPTPMIEFWVGLAVLQVRQCIWKSCWVQGVSLYVAHEITLAAQNQKAALNGGVPGVSGGIANSKTVGSVSVGYDTTSTAEKDAGYWNLTNYGKQFIRLARIFGAQAIQL